MLIAAWSDKGGTGKTTLATNTAARLGAPLLDLDPQGDAARWAVKAGHPCHKIAGPGARERLIAAANAEETFVVDCPPGRDPSALQGMAFAQFVIVPTRSGDADLVALARALEAVKAVQANGNPELRVAVVLNAIRETGRAKGIAQALRVASGYTYLGEIRERLAYEEAYSDGKAVEGGPAGAELSSVLAKLGAAINQPVAA